MKKICLLIFVMLLTGCGNKELDLNKIKTNIYNIKGETFAFDNVYNTGVQSSYFFSENIDEILEDLNLLNNKDAIGYKSAYSDEYYIIAKFNEEEKYNKIIEIQSYFNDKDEVIHIEEYQEYIIFVSSSKPEKIFDIIKTSKINPRSNLKSKEIKELDIKNDNYIFLENEENLIIVIDSTSKKDKTKIEKYFGSRKLKYEKFNNHMIFIHSNNEDQILKVIKKWGNYANIYTKKKKTIRNTN